MRELSVIVLGKAAAGRDVDVWVTDQLIQVCDGDQLLRTQLRQGGGEIRKKRASISGGRSTVKTSVIHHPEYMCHPSTEKGHPYIAR